MLSAFTQVPEIALEESEAAQLAKASGNVMRHYNIRGLDEKTVDWGNLIMALGTVYGTRIMAFKMRKNAERATKPKTEAREPQQNHPGPFVEIPGVGKVQVQ